MTPAPDRIFVADKDRATIDRLTEQLKAAGHLMVGHAVSVEAALSGVVAERADVLVLDQSVCDGDLAPIVRRAVAALPQLCVLVTAASGASPRTMGLAVAAGARSFLLKPYMAEDALALLREASGSPTKEQRMLATHHGKIIAVYGPKGGVGRTTIATNLAVALAQSGRSVALVDLDLQFGNVGVALNLKGVNSVAELVGHQTLSAEVIRDTFLQHPTGVRVLVAPSDLTRVEGLDPAQVCHVLGQLRGHFDDVVCDMWSMFEDLTRSVLRLADRVVLVTTPEVPALRSLRRVLTASGTVPGLDERSVIVLNRAEGKAGFRTAEVAKALERRIAVAIPSDGVAITEAVNRGLSILDPRLRSRAAGSYRELAKLVAAPEARAMPAAELAPIEAV